MPIRHSRTLGADPGALVLRPALASTEVTRDATVHTASAPASATNAPINAAPSPAPFGLPTQLPGVLSAPALPRPESSLETYRDWGRAAGEYAATLARHHNGEVIVDLSEFDVSSLQFRQLCAGALEGSGSLGDAAVGAEPDGITGASDDVQLCVVAALDIDDDAVELMLAEELTIRRATRLAVELTNARSNQLTPAIFAERARGIAQRLGLGFRATAAAELQEQGFGGITAIGKGSAQPPVLVELWYSPNAEPGTEPTSEPPQNAVALAGKGVTFDSGGLSIKPAAGMYSMHTDCAGAATVIAALAAHAEIGGGAPVHVALPLVENIPGPDSVRPGDVVTMRNGVGLEIIDTDFEGRVILADAVSRLAESQPRALLSFATLTYQIQIALGPEIAGLFPRDAALAERTLEAAEQAGEALWEMPWATRYADQLVSTAPGALLRNHPLRESGRAITAALFIGEFAPQDIPFAHIDFAGPTVSNTPNGPRATGYGVRTIVELLRRWD